MYTESQQLLIDALANEYPDFNQETDKYVFNSDETAIIGFVPRNESLEDRIISNTRFMDRFYPAELLDIYTKAKTDVQAEIFKDRVLADKDGIFLDDPTLRERLEILASIITYEQSQTAGKTRVDELLS